MTLHTFDKIVRRLHKIKKIRRPREMMKLPGQTEFWLFLWVYLNLFQWRGSANKHKTAMTICRYQTYTCLIRNNFLFTSILENGYLLLHLGHRWPELSLLIVLLTSRAHWGQSARWTQREDESEWQKTGLLVIARLPRKQQFGVTHTSMKTLSLLCLFC